MYGLSVPESAGPTGLRLPPVADPKQDHQRPGPVHRGPGLLHRVQPHPRGRRPLPPPEDPGHRGEPARTQTDQMKSRTETQRHLEMLGEQLPVKQPQ